MLEHVCVFERHKRESSVGLGVKAFNSICEMITIFLVFSPHVSLPLVAESDGVAAICPPLCSPPSRSAPWEIAEDKLFN